MAVKSMLACGLQTCVGNLWKGDDFSDFTIVVEDTSFSCHRFILSACSGFFQALFRSQMKESLAGLAKLNRMTKETFEIIINSIYKGTEELTEETVLDVWIATHLLQIDYLIEACKQFVIHSLSVDNCFRFLKHAKMYSAQEVIDSCLVCISKNFEQFRNAGSFLQLPLDYFYKVIESDILATSSEDSVVDAILTWMEYQPDPEDCSWLYTVLETLDGNTAGNILLVADMSTHILAIKDGQENRDDYQGNQNIGHDNEKDDQEKEDDYQENVADVKVKENIGQSAAFVIRNDENSSISESSEDRVEPKSHIITSDGNKTMCNKNRTPQTDSKEADRKQHFLKLISACRLFLVKPTCLENLLKNHTDILISTGAYNMVLNALMYSLSVALRHEGWPEAAVHRASSSFKHVMVFLSYDMFKAYSLDSGSVHEFVKVPIECKVFDKIMVFDNTLYLFYQNKGGQTIFSMLTEQKGWASVSSLDIYNSYKLLAHGNYIYVLCETYKELILKRWSYAHGHSKWMAQTSGLITESMLIRFQLYIVIFIKRNWDVAAHCFNTETGKVHVRTTSISHSSNSMTSFSSNEDVYVLEENGSLWKVFSTNTTPVDFVLVCKLWNFTHSLKGCVLYRKRLYIFHDKLDKESSGTLLTSLPGICEDIAMIQINSTSQCLPIVLPGSWLTS